MALAERGQLTFSFSCCMHLDRHATLFLCLLRLATSRHCLCLWGPRLLDVLHQIDARGAVALAEPLSAHACTFLGAVHAHSPQALIQFIGQALSPRRRQGELVDAGKKRLTCEPQIAQEVLVSTRMLLCPVLVLWCRRF